MTLVLACSVWMRGRRVEPPTIGFVIGMLFALPSIRNIQPSIPGIGITADVVGFLWNMFIVALSGVLLLLNYIFKYRKEKTAEVVMTDESFESSTIVADDEYEPIYTKK